jgi:ribosomal protein S18 acetylase RimI-like enzyme
MLNAILYREMLPSEYEKLILLWQFAGLPFKVSGRDSRENILKQMKSDSNRFVVAILESEFIGSVIASHDFRKGWLNRLAVHPDFRKMGIAKRLIELAESYFQENGIFIYACTIEATNEASKKLFTGEGYTEHHDIYYFSKRTKSTV